MSTVSIKNVTKSFGDTQVIRDFSDVFQDGEFITLLGPSGCGKTTMLRMIAGFEKPTSGEIWIDDVQVSGGRVFVPPEQRSIGMVFQSYAVWPHMNVFDNVAYPLKVRHENKTEIAEKVSRILETVHLSQYAKRLPNQLSGGQQQRIALARALVAEPKLLLLDEPLSNLDAKLRETMRFEIKELTRALRMTVVYVTHDQTEAMTMSDRILLINGGVVQQSGTPEEIYTRPVNPFVADFLGKVDFFKGEAKNGIIRLTDWGAELRVPEEMQHSEGNLEGPVQVAIRPENLVILPVGESGVPRENSRERNHEIIRGTLTRMYYLGDETDFRVRVGQAEIRVTGDGFLFRRFHEGEEVEIRIWEFMVFPDTGIDRELEILT